MAPSTRKRALITGASAGIGAEFARQLAARGCDLVLTARREDRLHALADALRTKYGIDVQVIADDLGDPGAPARIADAATANGRTIDILVNNAGYGVPGRYDKVDWATHARFMQVLVTAPLQLCHLLLPAMRERGYGRIVNVASLAGLVPATPGNTLYGPAKAFLMRVSQALATENRAHGIHVCALCPGFTRSEFHDVSQARGLVSKLPGWMWSDAADVVRQGLDAVERGRVVCVPGRVNRGIKVLMDLLPDRVALALVARRAKHFRMRD
ncbi:MAG: Oxidoreductase, short-chain dehydrogenase/reductase family [Rhodanobacteraceae bacterium]|jgi:short-subunit dehydrogenase|nr:MAG: Oxidoreductase, short-chain dehydrogenase/reductase family [Rhodanobacteraceae bacterium]